MSSHEASTKIASDTPLLVDAIEISEDSRKFNENKQVDESDARQAIEFEHEDETLLRYNVASSYESLIYFISVAPAFMVYVLMLHLTGSMWVFILFLLFIMIGFVKTVVTFVARRFVVPWFLCWDNRWNSGSSEVPRACTTATGIEIVQPQIRKSAAPHQGEIFIPYSDIESVDVGVSASSYGYAVTTVKIIFRGSEMYSYAGDGCSSIARYAGQPNKFFVVLLGLKEPLLFQKAALEKKPDQTNEDIMVAISVNEIV